MSDIYSPAQNSNLYSQCYLYIQNKFVYLKVRSTTLVSVHSVSSSVDLTGPAELEVEETDE